MYHHNKALLLVGFLLLSVQSDWKALAEDCVELKVHSWKVATCCRHETFLDTDALTGCFNASDAEHPGDKVESVLCAFDCAYREMGFLEAEYEIDAEKINARHSVYDEAYQQAVANAVDHCIGKKAEMQKDAELVPSTCNSFAVKFHACIVVNVMENCPADRWDASPLCEKIKAGAPICRR